MSKKINENLNDIIEKTSKSCEIISNPLFLKWEKLFHVFKKLSELSNDCEYDSISVMTPILFPSRKIGSYPNRIVNRLFCTGIIFTSGIVFTVSVIMCVNCSEST